MAGVHRVENVTTVWKSLVETCLPLGLNRDVDFWWDLTGRHMAQMVEAAGYSVERQYEILLFHYHWIVSNRFINDFLKRMELTTNCEYGC